MLISDAVGLRKPDERIFKLGCTELGVSVNEAVFVGDNPVADIEGASRAGLSTIYVPSKENQEAVAADAVCTEFADLHKIVTNL